MESLIKALQAIIARANEDLSNPELKGYVLTDDASEDIKDIASDALIVVGFPGFFDEAN